MKMEEKIMKMNKLKRVLKAGLVVSTAMSMAFSLAACGSNTTPSETGASSVKTVDSGSDSDTIRIGVLTDLTGSLADYGIGVTAGYELAAEEINSSGGINGKRIEFVTYDCKGDNNVYQEMARKVCLEDDVDAVFGGVTSASREAIRPIMEENEMLYFYDVQYEGGVASHYTFCTGLIPEQQIDPMIEYLLGSDMYPGASCYILAADYNFGQISTQWAEKAIAANGGTVAGKEYIPMDVSQFATTISNINSAKPDIIISFLVGDQSAFYEQWHNEGIVGTPVATSVACVNTYEHKKFAASIMENVYVIGDYTEELDSDAAKEFTAKFREKFSESEVPYIGITPESAYTTLYMYKQGVEKAGTTETEAVIAALESGITFDAPSGKIILNGDDHHTTKDVVLFSVDSNNNLNPIKMFEGIRSNYISGTKGVNLAELGKDAPNVQYEPIND